MRYSNIADQFHLVCLLAIKKNYDFAEVAIREFLRKLRSRYFSYVTWNSENYLTSKGNHPFLR